jgi:hypothetical protein
MVRSLASLWDVGSAQSVQSSPQSLWKSREPHASLVPLDILSSLVRTKHVREVGYTPIWIKPQEQGHILSRFISVPGDGRAGSGDTISCGALKFLCSHHCR